MGCFGIKAAYKGECRKGGSTSAPSPPNGIAVGERDPTCTCPLYFVYDPGEDLGFDSTQHTLGLAR
jgi:hypothetical protein